MARQEQKGVKSPAFFGKQAWQQSSALQEDVTPLGVREELSHEAATHQER